jgi:hypothetical protein
MWLITTRGSYSVVQDDDDARMVLVRARAREDLDRIAELLPGLEPWHDPSADHPWRARMARSEWAYALGVMAGEIGDHDVAPPVDDLPRR